MGTGTCKEPVKTQTCLAFPVRGLAGRHLLLLASYLKLGMELILWWQQSFWVIMRQHKLQAAVLVYMGQMGPWAQALCLASWQVLGTDQGHGSLTANHLTSVSTCAAGPGCLGSQALG